MTATQKLQDAIGGALGAITSAQEWIADLSCDANDAGNFDISDQLDLVFESLGRTVAELRQALADEVAP